MEAGALLDLLGNENRRRILRLLSRKPYYVTELSERLGVSPKAVIEHLGKLEDAGLIESRTDDQRRKYFHIAENLRLEVRLAPHGFGMKSAYAASPNLDLSRCQHLSIELERQDPEVDAEEVAALAAELDDLEDVERELSLAQRWVQGRISAIVDELADRIGEGQRDAEILAALADGGADTETVGREADLPPAMVEERLRRLEQRGVVTRDGGEWRLAG